MKQIRGLKKHKQGSEFIFKNVWTFRLEPASDANKTDFKSQPNLVLEESCFVQPCKKEEPLPIEWFDFSQLAQKK
jgi:hypothetical protein